MVVRMCVRGCVCMRACVVVGQGACVEQWHLS